jgi:hypothetical protein
MLEIACLLFLFFFVPNIKVVGNQLSISLRLFNWKIILLLIKLLGFCALEFMGVPITRVLFAVGFCGWKCGFYEEGELSDWKSNRTLESLKSNFEWNNHQRETPTIACKISCCKIINHNCQHKKNCIHFKITAVENVQKKFFNCLSCLIAGMIQRPHLSRAGEQTLA